MAAATIPLMYQSPQFMNPLQARQQGLTIAEMMQRGQLQQQQQQLGEQQIQAAQMENQQRNFQLQYQQELNQAMMAGYGGMTGTPSGTSAPPSAPVQQPAPPAAAPAAPAPVVSATAVSGPEGDSGMPAYIEPSLSAPSLSAMGLEDGSGSSRQAPTPAAPSAPPSAAAPASAAPSQPQSASIHSIPQIDYGRMANYVSSQLAQKGFGSMVPGFNANYLTMVKNQAEITKAQLDNERGSLEQASGLLQGVKDQASYDAVLPRARQLIQAGGLNPGSLPDQYSADTVKQGIGWGVKATDMMREAREAADLHFRMAQGVPKTASEYENAYNEDISGSQGQADLTQKNLKWDAIAAQDPTGMGKSILNSLKVNTWAPDVNLAAAISTIKPADRPKFFQNRLADASQQMGAAAASGDPGLYTNRMNAVVRQYPETSGLWANPADVQDDPDAAAKVNNQVGQTGAERITAQNLMQYREDLLGIRQQMANLATQKETRLGNGAQMTPNRQQIERRSIDNLEQGTPAHPGLHSIRLDAGADISKFQRMLTTGKDAAGRDLGDDDKDKIQDKLDKATKQFNDATSTLQSVQYRKARLYGVTAPDPMDVQAAKDGDAVPATDGSVWTKRDGVAYYTGTAAPAAAAPAPPAPAAPPPPRVAPARPSAAGAPATAAQTPPTNPPAAAHTPGSQPKVFPRARLAGFAAANGLTAAQAEAALKNQNYAIQ